MELLWGNPPPPGNKWSTFIVEVVTALRTRPGDWAEIPPKDGEYFPSTFAGTVRKYEPLVETTMKPSGEKNRFRVWARYNGPTEEPKEPEPPKEPETEPPVKTRKGW